MADVLENETPKVAKATILRSGRLPPGPPRESAHPVRQAAEGSMSASMLHDISPRSPERYAVSGELMGELTTFLDNHLNALLRTQQVIRERGAHDIFTDPAHQHEAALLRQLAPGGKIDEERVKVFLSTNEGKMATVVLLEDVAWKNLAVMNLRVEQTGAPLPRREDHLHLGYDRGVMNTWVTKHIDDLRTAGMLSGPVAAAVALAAATGIWPIAAGGPAADAIISFARSFRGGATLRTRECEEIGDIIRRDPNEQIYFWNTYAVNMDNPNESLAPEKRQEQLLETLYTRFQLLNELGFPPRDITALPDFILRRDILDNQGQRRVDVFGRPQRNPNAREQEDTLWRKQVIDEYNQLEQARIAVLGRQLNRDEEIQLVFEAQANVVLRNAEVAFEEITVKESEETLTRRHQQIKARIESTDDADFQKSLKKLKEARDALTRLNGDGGLGGEDQKLIAYTQALKKLEVARARAFAQFGTADLAEVDKLVNGVTDERLVELRQQLFDAEKAAIDQRQASETISSIFKSGQDNFTEIIAGGLTQDELAKLSFDALLSRINAAGLWQAADNAEPQNRMRLMLAIAEAKSRKSNPEIIPDANRALDRIIAVAGAPSENLLWAMTGDQLRKYFADNLLVWPVDGVGNPIDANRVIEQARGRFSTRLTYIQEIIHGENARTSRHNAIVGRETGERQQKITSLQELRQVILQNETKMIGIRDNGSELASEIISSHFSTYQEASDFITRIDRLRKGTGDNSYDWASLAGLTPDQIMAKFNGLPGGLGWPVAENTRPDHMRTVALIKAEADARRQNPNVFSDNPALVELENLQVHEDDIRLALAARTSVEEFIRGKINNGWDASNKDTVAYVRSAFDQVAARQQLRESKIQAVMEANPNYRESVAKLNLEYVSLERDLIKKQTEAQGIMGGARPDAAQIRAAINTLEAELRNFEEFAEIQGLDQLILQFNAFRTALSGLDNARNAIKQEVPGVSISTVSEMDAEMKKRKDQAETRNAIRNGLKSAEDEFAAASETTETADKIIDQLVADFDAILKIQTAVGGAARLSPAILANGTIDQIMAAVNALHVAGRGMGPPPILVGWPDNLNKREDLRLKVANAIVEARAQVPPRSARLTQVIGVGLTESYLRSATLEAIAKRLNESGLGPINLANPAARTAVSNLILEARTAFNKRKASLEQMTGNNIAELLQIEGDISQGEKGAQAAKESFQVLEGLLSRREIIYSNVEDIPKNIGRFTDGTLLAAGIPAADNYRAAEIGMGLPVGMYEIYNLIFDYQTGKREENFERVTRVLPPDQLVTIFASSLNLPGFFAAGIAGQQAFLTALQNAPLTDRALRRAVRSLMSYLAPREFGG